MRAMRLVCAVLALVVLAGPVMADRKAPAPAVAPFDDGPWVRYVGPEYIVYMAFRGTKHAPGPIVRDWLTSLDRSMSKDRPDNPVGQAVKAKVLERALDVFDGGGVMAMAGSSKAGKVLLVLARTPQLDRLIEWAKKTFTKAPYLLKEKTVEGTPALLWEEKGKVELAIGVTPGELVLADKESELVAALKLAKDPLKGFAGSPGYRKLRPRVRPDAAGIASIVPGEALLQMFLDENRVPQMEQAVRVALRAMTGVIVEVHGDAKTLQAEYMMSLDPKSEGYAALNLDKRHKFYMQHTVKAADAIPGDVVAYFMGLQPSYDTREIPATGTYVGLEKSQNNQQQWDVLKGQLQVQTGLSFDAEVVPWLGPESAVFVRPAPKDTYEIGGVIDVTDAAAATAALEKAVRHIKIARGVPFTEGQIGTVKVMKAKPAEANPAFAPAACVTDKHLVLGTAPGVVEATVQFPVKASASETYTQLQEALGKRRIVMLLWAQAAPIAKLARTIDQGRAARNPDAKPTEFISILDQLDSVAVGMSMPEMDLVHGHFHIWGR